MSKPEWGIKRVCPSCNIKYYDFNKTTIICPKCGLEFDPDLLLKSRKGRSIATKIESNTVSTDTKKEEETSDRGTSEGTTEGTTKGRNNKSVVYLSFVLLMCFCFFLVLGLRTRDLVIFNLKLELSTSESSPAPVSEVICLD